MLPLKENIWVSAWKLSRASNACVGDVRYIGLFTALELVKDKGTKQTMPSAIMGEIGKSLKENGFFTFVLSNAFISCVFVVPPLCVTREQIDEGLAILQKALEIGNAAAKN